MTTTRRVSLALVLALLGAGLCGCGQMGPLVLPDETTGADAGNEDESTNGGDDERDD